MSALRLRIDHMTIELDDPRRAAQVEATLRAALALLARRLAGAPLGRSDEAVARALATLELEPIAPGRLLSAGGAARLADDLYARIAEAVAR